MLRYDTLFFIPQQHLPYVFPGMGYELIVSLQKHDQNPDAIDLVDKIFTIVDGDGKGQSAVIDDYQAEYKEYTLTPTGTGGWGPTPGLRNRSSVPKGRARMDSSTTGKSWPSTLTLAMSQAGRLWVRRMRENTSDDAASLRST